MYIMALDAADKARWLAGLEYYRKELEKQGAFSSPKNESSQIHNDSINTNNNIPLTPTANLTDSKPLIQTSTPTKSATPLLMTSNSATKDKDSFIKLPELQLGSGINLGADLKFKDSEKRLSKDSIKGKGLHHSNSEKLNPSHISGPTFQQQPLPKLPSTNHKQ